LPRHLDGNGQPGRIATRRDLELAKLASADPLRRAEVASRSTLTASLAQWRRDRR
jgi:hypothetical protein